MPCETTAGEFVAESLEAEANKLPDSKKETAAYLRESAKYYREHGGKKKIRVWDESEFGKADFIKPDPASH